jgi:hypothetical protein
VCEVLPKVEMLSTLTSPEDGVALLLDGRVLLRRECHILEEPFEVRIGQASISWRIVFRIHGACLRYGTLFFTP